MTSTIAQKPRATTLADVKPAQAKTADAAKQPADAIEKKPQTMAALATGAGRGKAQTAVDTAQLYADSAKSADADAAALLGSSHGAPDALATGTQALLQKAAALPPSDRAAYESELFGRLQQAKLRTGLTAFDTVTTSAMSSPRAASFADAVLEASKAGGAFNLDDVMAKARSTTASSPAEGKLHLADKSLVDDVASRASFELRDATQRAADARGKLGTFEKNLLWENNAVAGGLDPAQQRQFVNNYFAMHGKDIAAAKANLAGAQSDASAALADNGALLERLAGGGSKPAMTSLVDGYAQLAQGNPLVNPSAAPDAGNADTMRVDAKSALAFATRASRPGPLRDALLAGDGDTKTAFAGIVASSGETLGAAAVVKTAAASAPSQNSAYAAWQQFDADYIAPVENMRNSLAFLQVPPPKAIEKLGAMMKTPALAKGADALRAVLQANDGPVGRAIVGSFGAVDAVNGFGQSNPLTALAVGDNQYAGEIIESGAKAAIDAEANGVIGKALQFTRSPALVAARVIPGVNFAANSIGFAEGLPDAIDHPSPESIINAAGGFLQAAGSLATLTGAPELGLPVGALGLALQGGYATWDLLFGGDHMDDQRNDIAHVLAGDPAEKASAVVDPSLAKLYGTKTGVDEIAQLSTVMKPADLESFLAKSGSALAAPNAGVLAELARASGARDAAVPALFRKLGAEGLQRAFELQTQYRASARAATSTWFEAKLHAKQRPSKTAEDAYEQARYDDLYRAFVRNFTG